MHFCQSITERAEAERSANQSQALWAACQALWASLRTATPGVHYKEKLRPLKNEINAIAKVAGKLRCVFGVRIVAIS